MQKLSLTAPLVLLTAVTATLYIFCPAAAAIDSAKYITIDEISTDMDAYCLTVLQGTEIEKFPLKIVSIVRAKNPGQDRILVIGTDERFLHVGTVQGCSGSPVYIDGRMAGALSAGWGECKDPLYLVTPIADMLEVGKFKPSKEDNFPDAPWTFSVDLSKPLDLTAIYEDMNSAKPLTESPFPLVTSLPQSVCSQFAPQFRSMGLLPLAASPTLYSDVLETEKDFDYVPGSIIAVPFVSGDIIMSGVGTVTEVVGNKIYAFGHQLDGTGPIDLPISNGYVHTVVASDIGPSFKLATAGKIKGSLRSDESAAVYGEVDKVAPTIPMTITVDRFNDTQVRTYNCRVAVHRGYTPMVVQSAIAGAAQMKGPVPQENFVTYSAKIDVEGFDPITFSNISSGSSVYDLLSETSSAVSMLMTNPYETAKINSFEFDIKIEPRNIRSVIDSVKLSNSTVKPGQTIDVDVMLEGYMASRTSKRLSLTIPPNTPPGEYEILIAGPNEYLKAIRKLAPQDFTAVDLPTIVSALNNIVSIKRDRLYLLMPLPSGGIVLDNQEMPYLPPTKIMLMADKKRTVKLMPQNHWIETSKKTDTLVVNRSALKITVERP